MDTNGLSSGGIPDEIAGCVMQVGLQVGTDKGKATTYLGFKAMIFCIDAGQQFGRSLAFTQCGGDRVFDVGGADVVFGDRGAAFGNRAVGVA